MNAVILKAEDNFVAAIKEDDGCRVMANCDGENMMYCFAAITAEIRDLFEKNGLKEDLGMLREIVDNILGDTENFPLNKTEEE